MGYGRPRKSGASAITTGIHLARRIGEALARTYKGDLTVQYADEEQSVRVYWRRQKPKTAPGDRAGRRPSVVFHN